MQKLTLLTVEGREAIANYREHSKIQYKLRQALLQHQQILQKGGEAAKGLEKNVPILKKQLIGVEQQMHKIYGMIPGLTYGSQIVAAEVFFLCDDQRLRALLQKEGSTLKASDIQGYVEERSKSGELRRLNRVKMMNIANAKDLELLQRMLDYGHDLTKHLFECRKALKQESDGEKKTQLNELLGKLVDKRITYEKNMKSVYGVSTEKELEVLPAKVEIFLYASLSELKTMTLLPSTQKRLIESLTP